MFSSDFIFMVVIIALFILLLFVDTPESLLIYLVYEYIWFDYFCWWLHNHKVILFDTQLLMF